MKWVQTIKLSKIYTTRFTNAMKFMYLSYFYVWANFETMLRDDNAKNQNAIDSIQINYMKVSQM